MLKDVKIGPMPIKYYIPCACIVLLAVYTQNLNEDIVGTFAFLLLAGWLFNFIGSRIPVFGTWMGGGILLPLFAGSALVYFHLISEHLQQQVSAFIGSGFINVFLGAIIVGSILSMDRKVLLNSTLRVLPCMLGAMAFVFVFLYLGCLLTHKSLLDGMFMVGLPNYTGGSSGAIAVVPQIYADIFHTSVGEYSAKFLVFMNISNLFCVIIAALLAKFGEKKEGWTGNGQLIKGLDHGSEKKESTSEDIVKSVQKFSVGLCVSCCFLVLGKLCQALVPQLNFIAWATILVVLAKVFGLMDEFTCKSTQYWQNFMVKNFLPFMITGIGIASLSTTNRMDMMPFAVIANRIGGAIMVILISLLVVLV